MKFCIGNLLKSVKKIQILLKFGKNVGHLREGVGTFSAVNSGIKNKFDLFKAVRIAE
jgi:hypothetical protein